MTKIIRSSKYIILAEANAVNRLVREDQVSKMKDHILVIGEDGTSDTDEYCEVTCALRRNGYQANYLGISQFLQRRKILDFSTYALVVILECEKDKVFDGFSGALAQLLCAMWQVPLLVVREADDLDIMRAEEYSGDDTLCLYVLTLKYVKWEEWVKSIVMQIYRILSVEREYVPEKKEEPIELRVVATI